MKKTFHRNSRTDGASALDAERVTDCASEKAHCDCGETHDRCGDDCDCGETHDRCGDDCDCGETHDRCGDDCDCEGTHGDGKRRLILDTRTSVTLCGIAGALIDLGVVGMAELTALSAAIRLPAPEVSVDIVKACRGICVRAAAGTVRDADWIAERVDLVRRRDADTGVLLEQIYRVIAATQEAEQGAEQTDLGSFAREDIFGLYAWIALMLTRTGTEGLTVTTVELGLGEYEDARGIVSAPASLAVRFVEGLDVVSTRGARGIDIPAAALLSACTTEQTESARGLLGACGYGLDGETITRIYLTE